MVKIGRAVSKYIRDTDKMLWTLCLIAIGFALTVIYSFSYNFGTSYGDLFVQGAGALLGIIGLVIISKIDYRALADLWKLHMPLAWLLVILTFFIGYERPGTDNQAWLVITDGVMIQPTEIAKLSVILTFGLHLYLVGDNLNNIRSLIPILIHMAVPVVIVNMQGDDGTMLIFIFVFISMLVIAGLSWKYMLAGAGFIAIALPIYWFFILTDHKRMRFMILLDRSLDTEGTAWQQTLGETSIGAGQVFGRGLFGSNPTQIPEYHNDFMFAYIGETMGLIGCMAVIILLIWIAVRLLMIGLRSQDKLGSYICTGVFAMLITQTVLNIGMNLFVLPVIGVTLPLFSSGGTSIMTMLWSIGLAMSVYMHNKTGLFSN